MCCNLCIYLIVNILKYEEVCIIVMSKRITIVIHDKTLLKLRALQAKRIKESTKSVSLSGLIDEVLNDSL